MNDKEIQRVILQFAYNHQHDHPLRIVSVDDISEIATIEPTRIRHNVIYLVKEGLLEKQDDIYNTIRLDNSGINLVENKAMFDFQFPIVVAMPEETKRMATNVQSLLQGKHSSVLEQFNKGVKFLYDSQPPDSLNSMKEVVGAVEALAKILLNRPANTLGDLAQSLSSHYMHHPAMEKIIHGIYGVASDVPGARHGAHRQTDFDKTDAEFILNVCSSMLIYLAKSALSEGKS